MTSGPGYSRVLRDDLSLRQVNSYCGVKTAKLLLQQVADRVRVTSRKTLRGLSLLFGEQAFTDAVVRKLTIAMPSDLKKASEQVNT